MASKFQLASKLSMAALLVGLMAGCATTGEDSTASQEAKPAATGTSDSTSTAQSSSASTGTTASTKPNANQVYFAVPWMRLDPATGRFYMQWLVWPNVGEYIGPTQAPAASTTKP